MNMMTQTLKPAEAQAVDITDIADTTAKNCLATRVRQLSRIITRVYDDAMRSLGITASQYTLLAQLASRDGITAVEIGQELDIEKSTLSRNLKRLLALELITMDPPAGRRGRGLHLTARGTAMLIDAYPIWQSAQKAAVAAMGHDCSVKLDNLLSDAEKLVSE